MRVVVDASVAKAAGVGRPDAGPPAPQAIHALDALREGGGIVVFGPKLKAEWERHARSYALKWLGNMRATRRFAAEPDDAWPQETALLDAAADLPAEQPAEVAKDAHLVSLAMTTDRRVLSLDDRQRALLLALLPRVPSLGALYWVSPRQPEVHLWLRAGTPEEPALQLQAR